MLHWRVIFGTLLIAAMVGLCWLDYAVTGVPGIGLMPLALLVTSLATGEVLDLAAEGEHRPPASLVHLANLLIVGSGWAPHLLAACGGQWLLGPTTEPNEVAWEWTGVAMAAGLAMALVNEMWRYARPGNVRQSLAASALALVYVGLLLSFAVHLRFAIGLGGLLSLVIVAKACDTGAYTVGRLLGRNKMAPVLSPGKTIEGAAGGLAFACAGAWLSFTWLVPALTPASESQTFSASTPWWAWLVFGLAVGTAATAGDLAESLLKRDAGRKDSARWLPGFGGLLDVVDSFLLAAPVAYVCWRIGLVP